MPSTDFTNIILNCSKLNAFKLNECTYCFFFLSNSCDCVRQERQLSILEHLVSALNIFLRSAAMNCRMRVCHLGEELLPSVLYVWMDMMPSVALKEGIVEFLNLQMCAHHPKGAKTQDTGRVSFSYFFKKKLFLVVLRLHGTQA